MYKYVFKYIKSEKKKKYENGISLENDVILG